SDVKELKDILKARNSAARVIAKIEKPEALRNIDEIIEVTDAIMIARGDLGVEIPTEEVPLWQKIIIRKCNAAARPVIVATQMLESMIENKRPTRAEATDVANAVLDGADCVMLSAETSTGKYPIEVVRTMQKIISIAEQEPSIYHRNLTASPHSPTFLSDATCVTAVKLAIETKAKALVGMTRSGYTAYQLAKCRPIANIFIFTDNPILINTMSLVWGVRVFYYDRFVGTNESIQDTNEILKSKGLVQPGDIVINCASMPLHARKRTNMMKVTRIE
ncbi:MAG: pyruvate kinase, partial [Bacteroidia bacterium]|nr:pyruvate kinase [Bacteroidia bacterium]